MCLFCAVLIAFALCVLELPGYPAPRKIDAFSKVPLIRACSYYHYTNYSGPNEPVLLDLRRGSDIRLSDVLLVNLLSKF